MKEYVIKLKYQYEKVLVEIMRNNLGKYYLPMPRSMELKLMLYELSKTK